MKKIFIVVILLILPINVFASSIVIDMDSSRVLYEESAHEIKLIASTTKIMTAILAIESNMLEDIVVVGEEVLKMYGSNIYIEMNEEILLLDLIYGLMLRSGNDAAVVIANYVGGTEENFIKMMNEKAKELNMKDTIFNNPHGLDEETKNYSTAYDLSLLYSYAYQNEIFKKIVKTKYYQTKSNLKTYSWINRADLLFSYDKTTGAKTGYTPSAGRILVSSASNEDLNLCIVTFNENDYDYIFHKNKYEDYFNKYKKYLILDKNNFYVESNDNVYIKESFYYPLTSLEYENIRIKTYINKKGNTYGQVFVYLEDDIIYKENIYITSQKISLFTKIINYFKDKLAF